MSGKKKTGPTLGAALKKNPAKPTRRKGYVEEWSQTQFPEEPKTLESIIDASDIHGIMENVSLQNERFQAERQNVVVLNTTSFVLPDKMSPEQIEAQRNHWNDLTIPRRPEWTTDMTAQQLDRIEKESFMHWRRKLAELEQNEHLFLTPFEKNIEVWRQLWRVLERSDLIVQILDSRDPLLFRSVDLEKYIDEFKTRKAGGGQKIRLLLLNKADLLTPQQRRAWADYFRAEGITFAFFSAYQEQLKINEAFKEERIQETASLAERSADADLAGVPRAFDSPIAIPNFNQRKLAQKKKLAQLKKQEAGEENSDNEDNDEEISHSESEESDDEAGDIVEEAPNQVNFLSNDANVDFSKIDVKINSDRVLTRDELFAYFFKIAGQELLVKKDKIVVGMVGYPNVGKSSTINVLYHRKAVAVSATPGKTKHFQTLKVNDSLTLCDCPGLVFPTFMSTRAEMVASGLLRIDEMKDYMGPSAVVARRIPREVLNHTYGLTMKGPKFVTGVEFLRAYAHVRGFYIALSKPDEFKAARVVLKDYVNGKLLSCRSPPTIDQAVYDKFTRYPTFPEFNTIEPNSKIPTIAETEAAAAANPEAAADDSDSDSRADFDPEDPTSMATLDEDGDEREKLFNAPKFSGRVKHERVNRRKHRRMKHLEEREPDRDRAKELDIGVYKSNNMSRYGQPLATNVKMVKVPKRGVAVPKASIPPAQLAAMMLAKKQAALMQAKQAAAPAPAASAAQPAKPAAAASSTSAPAAN